MNSRVRTIVLIAAMGVASLASGSAMAGTGAPAAALGGHAWHTAIEVPGTAALNQRGDAQITSVSCASAGNCSAGGFYDGSQGRVASGQAFVVSQTGGTWHTAIEVPGTAALNQGGVAAIESVSCGSAGNCSAGGYYRDSSGGQQVFVAGQVNGTWRKAIEMPGTRVLNQGGNAEITSVSCASAGNCSAGGFYLDSSGRDQAYVAGELNGTWHAAIEVPGTAALGRGGGARALSVSCASAGNCAAGGLYTDSSGNVQAFVASEVNGTWHAAIEVPGTAAHDHRDAQVNSVSCASAGNCSAGGSYTDSSGHAQAFVAGETNGTWGAAQEVPGTAALNSGGEAVVSSVSCASAGNCAAGGYYVDSSGHAQAFVANEKNGTWHAAIEVPGTAALNHKYAQVYSVSCASAGNCAAGGVYTDSSHRHQAFVASEVNGTWHAAIEVPGTAALNQGGRAGVGLGSVSCASAGNCAIGGFYTDSVGAGQAFVASEVNGTWHAAIEVPGTAALNQRAAAGAGSVSCASAGNCAVGGSYADSSGHRQVFVAGEVNGTWQTAVEVPGTAALNQGGRAGFFSVSCAPAGNCAAGGFYTDSSRHEQAFVVNKPSSH